MQKIYTKIGDHFILVICESEKMENFFDKNFVQLKMTDKPKHDLVIVVKDGYGLPFQNYEVNITKIHEKITYERADYLIKVDPGFTSAMVSVYDELALKHAFTNLYSSFIVHHRWGLLVHSSCAIESGKAHIFAGHSGAGKSTAAELSFPRTLLSDEATLVKITEKGITIYNSPFRSELDVTALNPENVELASVQILYQALQHKRTKLGKSNALMHLMDKVFYWPHCEEETKTILRLMTLLVTQIPVFELHFQKNNRFWELIS